VRGIAAAVLAVALVLVVVETPVAASPAQNTSTQSYTIQQGDTLWNLSRRFGTTPERIAELNGIGVDDTLSIGRILRLPGAPRTGAVPASRPAKVAAASPASRVVARTHRVRAGDTLWGIARRYGTTPKRLAAMNRISETAILSLGRRLKVPGTVAVTRRAPAASTSISRSPQASAERLAAMRKRLAALPSRGEKWMSDMLALSRRYLGVRYRWAGTSPSGFDCSGFMYYVYGRMGVALPRTTYDMYDAGAPVPREDLREGDLVFFQTLHPGPSHAGIYLGDGRFIHASSGSRRVLISSMEEGYYAARFLGARRF
jgi:cell wall-associated NlpC family hydrolase